MRPEGLSPAERPVAPAARSEPPARAVPSTPPPELQARAVPSTPPPERARPPVLPPKREPAEPRVHIGEVHVVITAPAPAPASSSSSAIPGHGSDLLNRHYLRNA